MTTAISTAVNQVVRPLDLNGSVHRRRTGTEAIEILDILGEEIVAVGTVVEVDVIKDLVLHGSHFGLVIAIVPMFRVDLLLLLQFRQRPLVRMGCGESIGAAASTRRW